LIPKLTKYIPHIPTPKQAAFLLLDCRDAFYGGSVAGGKSDALLMAALQYVDMPGYSAVLLRDSHTNLTKAEGLIPRADLWLHGTDARWDGKLNCWVFPTGVDRSVSYPTGPGLAAPATLAFSYLDSPKAHIAHKSAAYQYVGIDECVSVPKIQALFMFSRLRRLTGSRVPVRFRCASNPPVEAEIVTGSWVKPRYIDPATRGDRVFLPAWLSDNPHVDAADYLQSLNELDPVTREQLVNGNWEVQASGFMFQRHWFPVEDSFPSDIPYWIRWWDLAATEEKASVARTRGADPDWTAGALCGVDSHNTLWVRDMRRARLSPAGVETLVARTAEEDTRSVRIWMEQEPGASGKATCSYFERHVVPGFSFSYEPSTGSKVEYARPLASAAERGDVRLVRGPWIQSFLEEVELFPHGPHDDMVDAVSKARAKLLGKRRRAGVWGRH